MKGEKSIYQLSISNGLGGDEKMKGAMLAKRILHDSMQTPGNTLSFISQAVKGVKGKGVKGS